MDWHGASRTGPIPEPDAAEAAQSTSHTGNGKGAPAGTARIVAATITRTADRWFVSFTVEVQRAIPDSNHETTVVGVDAGIRHLAVLSPGAIIANPRALDSSLRKLRRLNRQLARRKIGSKRRSQSRARLARVHARAANLRRVEQLNLAGMARNRRLARALADAGLGELRRRLTDNLVRQSADSGRPVLSLFQVVLRLRVGESQAHPGRAHLRLRGLRTPARPGSERRS